MKIKMASTTLVLTMLVFAWATCAPNLGYGQEQLRYMETGNDLLRVCQSEGQFDRGVCDGYVTAVSQMAQIADHACYPQGVTLGQGEDVVVQYLKGHPESRQRVAATLAAKALTEAFPCKEKPAK